MSILRSFARELRLWNPVDAGIVLQADERRLGWTSWAGVAVNEIRALQLLTVWSCVSLISDSLGILPVGRFRSQGPTRQPLPDPPLLRSPHAEMTWSEWMGRMSTSALLRGNAFGLVTERDAIGIPTQIWPVHPDEVSVRRNQTTKRVEYLLGTDRMPVESFDVLHVKGLTLSGRSVLEGLSPIEYARQAIGFGLAAQEFGARFFGDGAHPSGVLQAEGRIDDDDARRYQASWEEAHGNRSRRPAVIGGGLKWEPVSLKPEEAQFLETRKFSRSEIAGFYRVPPHMIGDVERSTSWGTGIEEQSLGYVTFTMGIWIKRFEDALSALFPRPQYVKFNVAGLLRGRLLDRYRAYLMGRQGSWLNADEIRALEDMPPLPEGKGQDYMMPLNFAVIPGENEPPVPPPESAP